ncbi:hypothetical protein OHB05_42320 [Streptomyces sp. NBC_00638]|uniref:hypothetical protein n=1 Tax=Streptomyces sp. NBC_00638 TaxID=2975794 RepID=UPI0022599313|nr:hypothetical protein [Streptomyces sp. NBC_00638]MCX5009156.1 hypothetical protein [Streptomyces sp. NBC_00638]
MVFDDYRSLFDPSTLTDLHDLFPDGQAQLWGVTPGVNDANLPQIRKMRAGDIVFFSGDRRVYLVGTVARTWHNRELAQELWGVDERTQQTWEYMYALSAVRGVNVPMDEVRSVLGWVPNRNIQGFVALNEPDGELLVDLVGFESAGAPTVPGPRRSPTSPPGPSTSFALAAYRAEQTTIKQWLIPGSVGECALCGRSFPKAFLVAAHIKKRAICSEEERWDTENIAMLACLLGCDSLYERGFITVEHGGQLQVSPLVEEASAVDQHIKDHLQGRITPWWTPAREPYYAWHRTHTFQTGALLPDQVRS